MIRILYMGIRRVANSKKIQTCSTFCHLPLPLSSTTVFSCRSSLVLKSEASCSSRCIYVSASNNDQVNNEEVVSGLKSPFEIEIYESMKTSENSNLKQTHRTNASDIIGNMVSKDKVQLSRHLKELFGIGSGKATQAVSSVGHVEFPITTDFLYERFKYLKEKKGLSLERVRKMPWILLLHPDELTKLEKKVCTILKVNFTCSLTFTRYHIDKLYKIKHVWEMDVVCEPEFCDGILKNRMDYMASMLKCSLDDVSDMFAVVPKLAVLPFDKLRSVLILLRENGVSSEDIIGDPWIFDHNIEVMKCRLKVARERCTPRIKPWLLRTEEEHFYKYVNRCQKEVHLLSGHADVASFLQKTLRITKSQVDHIMFKVPVMKHASARKLDGIIEFLFSKGYTTEDILKTPRILARGQDTLESRMKELTSMGFGPVGFPILCLSNKDYKMYLKRLISTPNKS